MILATERPKKISAPTRASSRVLSFVLIACADFHWLIFSFLSECITPLVSHRMALSFGRPIAFKSSRHAMPAAPAPFTTTLVFFSFLPVRSKALIIPAVEIIAVPCWSSWKTGISICSLRASSIIKHSGAFISSRLIPPKEGPKYLTELINSSVSSVSISRSMESISENLLNKTALPSITGFEADAPKLPSPSIAVPFVITATRLPLIV